MKNNLTLQTWFGNLFLDILVVMAFFPTMCKVYELCADN